MNDCRSSKDLIIHEVLAICIQRDRIRLTDPVDQLVCLKGAKEDNKMRLLFVERARPTRRRRRAGETTV